MTPWALWNRSKSARLAPAESISADDEDAGWRQEWLRFSASERLEVLVLCIAFVVVFWLVVLFAGFSSWR